MERMLSPTEHGRLELAAQIVMQLRSKHGNRKDAIDTIECVLAVLLVQFDQSDFEENLQRLTENLRRFHDFENGLLQ